MNDDRPPVGPEPGDPAGLDRVETAGFSLAHLALLTRDRMLRSRFARDVTSLWSAQVAVIAIAAVQGLVVARVLGPRGYGVAGLVASFPALVFVFLDARSADASIRYLGEFTARGDTERALAFCKLGFMLDVAVGVASALVVLALSPVAEHHIIRAPEAGGLLVVYAVGMALRAPGATAGATLVTLGRFRLSGSLQVGSALARAILIITTVATGGGISGVVWATSIGIALEGLVLASVASRLIRAAWGGPWWNASLAHLHDIRGEIAHFLLWSDLGSTLGLAVKQVDVVAIGYFVSVTAAGYYRLAVSLGALAGALVPPLQSVLYQRFARFRGAGDRDALVSAVRNAALWICLPLGSAALAGVWFVPFAIHLVAGPRYEPAGTAARIMVASASLWLVLAWVRPLALTMGDVKALAAIGAVVAVLSLAGFASITPSHGFVGTAWVRFAMTLLMQGGVAVVIVRRHARTHFGDVAGRTGVEG